MPKSPHPNLARTHQYSALFYRYQREGSARSAGATLPHLLQALSVRSVLDVGCGAGAWLSVHQRLGVADVVGIDGDYVDRSLLLVAPECFKPGDIAEPFDLGRRFDLVQCLEVAEHVSAARSDALIDNLVRHGPIVLFSAAVPGQGGEDHINEKPCAHWRDRFAQRGYHLFDFLRSKVLDDPAVEPWYRYNLMLFVHDSAVAGLPAAVAATRVADRAAIKDFSPWPYRLRKAVLRLLAARVVTELARWKHRRVARGLGPR